MKPRNIIKPHYTPIQPTAGKTENVVYKELFPDTRLQDLVYCYWQLKTTQKLTETYNYNVVADGCMDVFFELNNPESCFVMGFSKTNTQFPLDNTFNYIGIRFLPTAFTRLFKIRAIEMSNRFESLHGVVPELSTFISHNVKDIHSHEQIAAILDSFFFNHLVNNSTDADSRFFNAFSLILKHNGLINIERDLNTGVSQRQLRRMFEHYTGANAKTFSKVVRFQNLLKLQSAQDSKDKLFYDAGYYDQAHFIKEFKKLYGSTPAKALDE